MNVNQSINLIPKRDSKQPPALPSNRGFMAMQRDAKRCPCFACDRSRGCQVECREFIKYQKPVGQKY